MSALVPPVAIAPVLASLCAGLLLAAATVAAIADDLAVRSRDPVAYGRDLFEAWCANCHAATAGGTPFAAPLEGLFGRKAGTAEGYTFSPEITGLGFDWSAESLESWLATLSTESPTTSIRHLGISNPLDRAALVSYVATLQAGRP